METTNFTVVKIEKGFKQDVFIITVTFGTSTKEYTYTRKSYSAPAPYYNRRWAIIKGYKVFFRTTTDPIEYLYQEKYYEVAGRNRMDTTNVADKLDEMKFFFEEETTVEEPAVEEPFDMDAEIFHEKYNTIRACIEASLPVYLAGPAGSGKNFTVEQVAGELGLDFYFTNSVQQEYGLTGFIDAGGTYHETEFFRAFTKGGVFFLDEMDASIPEVLVLLNAAIANGYFEFPTGKVNCHDEFRVVAAGNTVGSGADEQYTGRMCLDQATLDRFIIVEFDYSEKVELQLAKGNKELVAFVRGLRADANNKGIRTTFSYRCIMMVTKLEGKLSLEEIITIAVLKGMDKDTLRTLNPAVQETSKYVKALKKIQSQAC